MLRTIHLHGALAEQFQPEYKLAVETPAEAFRALFIQVKGFEKAIRAGEFICIRGDFDYGLDCDESLLKLNLGSVRDFHIVPAAVGAGRGGGKILLGIALIGAVLITGGAALAAAGIGMTGVGGVGLGAIAGAGLGGGIVGAVGGFATLGGFALGAGALLVLGGTAQAISAMATASEDIKSNDQKAGFVFNGAINTSVQGSAVPLVFGRIEAGSIIVSAGATAERLSEVVPESQLPNSSGNISYA